MRNRSLLFGAGLACALAVPASPASAGSYHVTVACTVPKGQPERQVASNSCLNYRPDGTQTYTARARDGAGRPVAHLSVHWTDSDSKDAHFRLRNVTCTTDSTGTCSDELVDDRPRAGEKITVTATAGGSSGHGYLTFK